MKLEQQNFIKNLIGHSGCTLSLFSSEIGLLVKKTAGSKSYNIRLKKQLKKQMTFHSNLVNVPQIYNYDYNDRGLFFFEMEFVSAKTLAEYTQDILITEIVDFVKCLFESIYFSSQMQNANANVIFQKKIYELEQKLKSKKYLENAFVILKNFDWSNVYKSPCHGDLTLENILITYDKQIYLIDFLDSFYNSWMIDIAKLLQDLELKWSFRNIELSTSQSLRIEIAKEALTEEILKLKNGKNILLTIYRLLLLNILRIYPYAQDSKTISFLDTSVEKLLLKNEGIKI